MIKAKNTIMKERILSIVWPASSCFILCIWTLARCCTREEPNLHLEFFLRDVTGRMRSPSNLPVDVVSKRSQEVITVAKEIENTVQPVIWLGFHSSAIENVGHEALWLAC